MGILTAVAIAGSADVFLIDKDLFSGITTDLAIPNNQSAITATKMNFVLKRTIFLFGTVVIKGWLGRSDRRIDRMFFRGLVARVPIK